jgi:hypothetical protein
MNRNRAAASELSREELAAQDAAELPPRQAMSLIDTAMAGAGPLPLDGTGAPADGAPADTTPAGGTPAESAPAAGPAPAGTDPLAGTGLETKLPLSNPFVG